MRIEEVIGENIRERRDRLGYSQTAFGERVGELLGNPWKPQTVSAAEKGRRQFIAAELVVLSHVLRCRVQDLLTVHPPQPVQISDNYVRDADYSAPLENAIGDGATDVSAVLVPMLKGFSEAYRSVYAAQEKVQGLLDGADDVSAHLQLAERALAGFMPADTTGDETWFDGAEPLPDVDEEEGSSDA